MKERSGPGTDEAGTAGAGVAAGGAAFGSGGRPVPPSGAFRSLLSVKKLFSFIAQDPPKIESDKTLRVERF